MPIATTKLHKTEFAIFRRRPEVDGRVLGEGHRVLASVSGGADSVAMLHILSRLKSKWHFDLEVAYVHHGDANDEKMNRYRTRAENKVRAIAAKLNLGFICLAPSSRSQGPASQGRASEETLRKIRHEALSNYAKKSKIDVVALGHHADDLFETRLIRLVRGTGPHGLRAMTEFSTAEESTLRVATWRPLLKSTRREVEDYLESRNLKKTRDWIVDPSNRDVRYLRNAIRHRLIPEIEKIRKGGAAALARSLDLLVEKVAAEPDVDPMAVRSHSQQVLGHGLNRRFLLAMQPAQRRLALAKWARAQGLRSFSKTHVDEVLKRIAARRKRLTFKTCGRVWLVDESIRLEDRG